VGRLKSKATARGHHIGALLRDRRRKMGLTLQALARSAGLSHSFLSQVEQGKAKPSLMALQYLANALHVEMNYFFALPDNTRILHRASNPEVIDAESPIRYIRLSSAIPDQRMEALIYTLPPKYVTPMGARNGESLYYVLDGRLRIELGDEVYDLGRGDSLHFNTNTPFNTFTLGRKPATVLWVGTPPLLEKGAGKTLARRARRPKRG